MSRITRRQFLHLSAAAPCALSSLGLAQHARSADAAQATPLIVLYLSGGASAKEFTNPDPPGSPEGLRGPLSSIATRTPGVRFCEAWPELARRQDQFALLRGLDTGSVDHATAAQRAFASGPVTLPLRVGERATGGGVPYVLLNPASNFTICLNGAFQQSNAFMPLYRQGEFIAPPAAPTSDMAERRRLLDAFDEAVPSPAAARLDRFRETALDLIQGGGRFMEAMQLDPASRERFGPNLAGDMILTATRLVDAGAGAVAVFHEPDDSAWDMHTNIADRMRGMAGEMDWAAASLIDEITAGRINATLLLTTEFNRTPRINDAAGRDHWPLGNQAILCGPRIRRGVVHGRTNSQGEILDGRVQQLHQLGNTVMMACGIEVSPAAPKVREVLR